MERITCPEVPGLALEIDHAHRSSFGPCECCGKTTLRVWGYVYRGEAALAAYFVEWTPGHIDREVTFDLIVGRWGEGAEAADRKALSLGFRHTETGPAFMVQNASVRPVGASGLVSEALDREQVLGTPLAEEAFALCDIIRCICDNRCQR